MTAQSFVLSVSLKEVVLANDSIAADRWNCQNALKMHNDKRNDLTNTFAMKFTLWRSSHNKQPRYQTMSVPQTMRALRVLSFCQRQPHVQKPMPMFTSGLRQA